jgi:UDP-N-acetylglucosamine 2-epimerase (hydrolysing)
LKKKILFVSGTRADFGKLKSLISIVEKHPDFDVHIFATGMHMHYQYGYTVNEILKSGFKKVYKYINYTSETTMDLTLAKTIDGLSSYSKEEKPDMIVVHGDRVEALAGAITGSLNNILVAHIEGGEVSGTIDELIRHSVSKMSHLHFVSNNLAKSRLLQMGELESSIYVIGSPDVDLMFSDKLPDLQTVKAYYNIPFKKYSVVMFHPVTTEYEEMEMASQNLVEALKKSGVNHIVIYPNNDLGSDQILRAFKGLENDERFLLYPSIRFEYFLTLLKHSDVMIGNSSAGIREAPYYGIPSVNIGSRQNNRAINEEIINSDYSVESISKAIQKALKSGRYQPKQLFGEGKSDAHFLDALVKPALWSTSKQKLFKDLS